jgi:D-cysteine desulfhydrase family pyridoxal phosphate-dependent enzyme
MQIGNLERVELGIFPTPLQELKHLSEAVNGPRIFIKRDDLDGLGLGGNKLRKLEYAMAEALEQRTTAVITTGGVQSNHVRLVTAAANRLGLKTYLILKGAKPALATGNLLIDRILGVKRIDFVDLPPYADKDEAGRRVEARVRELEEELRQRGEVPYYIPNGCRTLHGALGYSNCVFELVGQLRGCHLAANAIVTASGTTSTQIGLILGSFLYSQGEIAVLGMSVSSDKATLTGRIAEGLEEAGRYLGLRQPVPREAIAVFDEYVGEGYGVPTPAMVEAVKLVARTEGIVLDPVYTGKAMAGLIDLIRKGRFRKNDTVIFLHTGGVPGLFVEQQSEVFQDV